MIKKQPAIDEKHMEKCKSIIQQADDQHVKDVKSLRDT